MKRIILTLFIALFSVSSLVALSQPPTRSRGHEQIAAQKVAYITDKLALTPAESEKFWPLYNQYWQQRRSIARAMRKNFELIENQTATAAQIQDMVKIKQEEVDVVERYAKLFQTVLSDDKVAKFFVAEESFKGFLFKNSVEKR